MSEALCIMYGNPADHFEPNKVGVYVCLSCRTHTIRRPPAPVGPSHVRTQWCGPIMCVHIHSLLPLLPIHPLHPVTSSHTTHWSRRFTSWPLTPPPRSDSVRSTVHKGTPNPTRWACTWFIVFVLSHAHHPTPTGPRRPLPRPYTVVRTYIIDNVCTYSFTPAHPPTPPHPPSSPCHIITYTTLVTQVHVVAVDPTPQVR